MFGFILKEFRHLLRDKRTLMILFGMPIALVLLFGYVMSNDIKDAGLTLWDKSKDEASTELVQKIVASGYFKIVEVIDHTDGLETPFRQGKSKIALVIEADFGKKIQTQEGAVVQVLADASDPNTATTLTSYMKAVVGDYLMEKNKLVKLPLQIQVENRMQFNPEMKSVYSFVPGVITMILMLVSAMMTSLTVAREKELGTMELLLVSPLRPWQILLGKTVPYMLMAFINAIFVIVIGMLVFKMPLNGSWVLLLAEIGLYMFVALALGLFISTAASNQMQALFMAGLGLMMPTMLLSGFIFPIESMPALLQFISKVIPATWFISILKKVMIVGADFEHVIKPTLVLLGMGLLFFTLGLVRFKDRLE